MPKTWKTSGNPIRNWPSELPEIGIDKRIINSSTKVSYLITQASAYNVLMERRESFDIKDIVLWKEDACKGSQCHCVSIYLSFSVTYCIHLFYRFA